jgi:hypothetical protein
MKTTAADKAPDIAEFSFTDFEAADEADMTVVMNGKPTTWIWTFSGPGHPKTVEMENREARERLHAERMKEQTVTNGKKWKAPDQTVDEIREKNISWIVNRLVRWSPVRINGDDYPFTPENARALLADRKKVALFAQALEFLTADSSFTQRSGTN